MPSRSIIFAGIALVLTAGAMCAAMKLFPDQLCEAPIIGLLVALVLTPLLVTLIIFRKRGGAEKIRIFATMLTFSLILGTIGNMVAPQTRLMPQAAILLNWMQAVMMLLGGIITGSVLFRGAPVAALAGGTMSSAASGATRKRPGHAAPTPESDKTAAAAGEATLPTSDEATGKTPGQTGNKLNALGKEKPKRDMSNSATNLRGMLDSFAADDEDEKPLAAKPADIAAKADAIAKKALAAAEDEVTSSTKLNVVPETKKTGASQTGLPAQPRAPGASLTGVPAIRPNASQTGLPEQKKPVSPTASATGLPEMRKPTATSTATRLQAQKRKSTSTFIKLQALSSSGTGASRPKTEGQAEGESLKSILDRLGPDDEADDTDFFGTDSLLSKPGSSQDKLPAVSPSEPTAKTSSSSLPAQSGAASQSPKATAAGTTTPTTSPATSSQPKSSVGGQASPSTSSSTDTAKSSGATSAPAAKADTKQSAAFLPKGSDSNIPAISPQKSLTKGIDSPAAKSTDAPTVSEPESKGVPEARLGEPTMTELLNSIKTPEVTRTESGTTEKKERGHGGLGGTSLGRVAGKKSSGIALGGTTSSNNLTPLPAQKADEAPAAVSESAAQPEVVPTPSATTTESPAETSTGAESLSFNAAPEAASAPPVVAPVTPDISAVAEVAPKAETVAAPEVSTAPEAAAPPPSPASEVSTPVSEVSTPVAEAAPTPSTSQTTPAHTQEPAPEPAPPVAEPKSAPPITSAAALVESLAEAANLKPENSTDFSQMGDSFKPTFDASTFDTKSAEAKGSLDFSAEPAKAEAAGNLFEKGVDQDIENIFSNLVPEEAQKEVTSTRTSYTRLDALETGVDSLTSSAPESLMPLESMRTSMGVSDIDPITAPTTHHQSTAAAAPAEATATPAPPAVAPAEVVPEQEKVPEIPAEAAAQAPGSLFETGVDQEIEDIFSNLVPPEAQKEVTEEVRASYTNLRAMTPVTESLTREIEVPAPEEKDEVPVAVTPEPVPAPSVPEPAPKAAVAEPVQTPPTSTPEPQPASESATAAAHDGLFDPGLDKEIDQIFQSLAPEAALEEVTKESLAKIKGEEVAEEISFAPETVQPAQPAAQPEQTPAPPEPAPTTVSEPRQDVTGELPATPAEAPASAPPAEVAKTEPVQPPVEAAKPAPAEPATAASAASETPPVQPKSPTPIVAPAKEVKEFGRLSSKSAKPGQTSETVGTMKTIGKLLIDVQAVENIIKTGETGTIGKNLSTARVVSLERGEGINALLAKIDTYNGVAGSLIVGHDGLVIASTVKNGKDKDSLGALSVACLGSTNLGTRKLEIGKLKQMVLITDSTITVLTDVQVGILAVFMDFVDIGKVDGLLDTIHHTIHG